MHKVLILIFFFCLVFFSHPLSASAHIAGQPPFFLINNKYADYYPIYSTSLKNFSIPQDLAPELYLINHPIEFEIDSEMLPFPPQVTSKIKYNWDFGDGNTATGGKNRHTYKKIGSFLLKITADYGSYSDPNTKPLLQEVLLHIIPNENYQLPKPKIVINGKQITNPLSETFSIPSGEKISFAVFVQQGTSPITAYFWDRGDGTKTEKASFNYRYQITDPEYLFPFVRVFDKNGFYVDTYAQIENITEDKSSLHKFLNSSILAIIGINFLFFLFLGLLFLKRKNNS